MTHEATIGPVELAVIEFDSDRMDGHAVPALRELVDSGVISILDLVLLRKDADGTVAAIELVDLDQEQAALFTELEGEVSGLLSDEDLQLVGADLSPGHMAACLVWENTWARRLAKALAEAGGRLVAHERIGAAEVRAALGRD
jgi:hypothetical protein